MKRNVSQWVRCVAKAGIMLWLGLAGIAAWAQTGAIVGRVIDAQNQTSLPGAVITIPGKPSGVVTDLDGYFRIVNLDPGTYELSVYYISYKTTGKVTVVVGPSGQARVEIPMTPNDITLDEVRVVAKANRESENVLLMERKNAILPTQSISSREMSRKGVGNAEAAVAQVAGVSKQDGAKNVLVRGLGDRYNATLLNGFPIPSEDPEYKNINLEFFGSNVIQNVGVNKVFNSTTIGDVGGATININSKELIGDRHFSIEASGGANLGVLGNQFLRIDGVNYLGYSDGRHPTPGHSDFRNALDPHRVGLPLNHGIGLSAGHSFLLGERNPLSFLIVGGHDREFSFTHERIRNCIADGTLFQDQTGAKSSLSTQQLLLANVNFRPLNRHSLDYNFLLVHANDSYVTRLSGMHAETFQNGAGQEGIVQRQQSNDNLLMVNQLASLWELTEHWRLGAGVAYNRVEGREPDRRENAFFRTEQGDYSLSASNRQKRFFSELHNDDLNVRGHLAYTLKDRYTSGNSEVKLGYAGRFVKDDFHAIEYNYGYAPGVFSADDLRLDGVYTEEARLAGRFHMPNSNKNAYQVYKYIHGGYGQCTYQLTQGLLIDAGLRYDRVDLYVAYQTQHTEPSTVAIHRNYVLPSLNLKYAFAKQHSIRLGASQTYTLPQSKEISPFQYVDIGFTSQGDRNIKPSDNYNADLRWEWYPTNTELVSLTTFYKYICNPIARADRGNSAGLLSYTNVSDKAQVLGVELEVRKNIINRIDLDHQRIHRLSIGLNSSYIYSSMVVKITNTPEHKVALEGAAPFIVNADLSYTYQHQERKLLATVVFTYTSDRIHTVGALGYENIVESGIPTLNCIASYSFNSHWSIALKANNLLNPHLQLTRQPSDNAMPPVVLRDYQKGLSGSLGIAFNL